MSEGDRIRVRKIGREVAGTYLLIWCHGMVGQVLRVDSDIIAVKLDDVSARELRFLPVELELE